MSERILLDLPDQFETERLLLRVPLPGEGAIRFAAIEESVDEIRPWTFVAQTELTLSDSEARCRRDRANFMAREQFQFHIWRKEDGAFVGNIFLRSRDWNIPCFEIGYWQRTSMAGSGYMSEAARGLAEYGFTYLGAKRLELFCDPRNRRSAAVAERAGFTLEARLVRDWRGPKGDLVDSLLYVQLAPEGDIRPRQFSVSKDTYTLLLDVAEQLESERLLLRAPRAGDAWMINEAVNESLDNLRPWMPWAAHAPTLDDTEIVAREMAVAFSRRESLSFRLLRRSDEQFIGMCSIFQFNWDIPSCEMGYWVRASAQGQGYITEAVNRLTTFAFDDLAMERIEIRCDARNQRSAAVAERAGYTLEARLHHHRRAVNGALADTLIYAKLRGD
jgi:RimJ/RimL family protein N-acetyltransferase